MIAFILWFGLLLGIIKMTEGWLRGFMVALYLLGSAVALL